MEARSAPLQAMATRSKSSQRWLQEHFADPFVKKAQAEGMRSRAAYKLEELVARDRLLKPGMTVVDLGAAPGGWTWVLTRHHINVTAVDNGPMQPALLDSGLVTHRREDGFRWEPDRTLDWMVCDMVDQPRRVATRMGEWFHNEWCRHAVFNLKLPMKKRWQEVQTCLDLFTESAGRPMEVRARQLYHDREEITVYATGA